MRYKFLIWSGIRAKIIAWTFLPTIAILSIVAVWAIVASQGYAEDLLREQYKALVSDSAQKLASRLVDHTDLLYSVARTPSIYNTHAGAQDNALKRASERLSVFDGGVVILDTLGQVTAASPEMDPDILGQDWSHHSYFEYFATPSGSGMVPSLPYFSEMLPDGAGHGNVVALVVPLVGTQGEFKGVLAGMFRTDANARNALYADIIKMKIEQQGMTYLLDKQGRVIYHSDETQIGQDFSTRETVQALLGKNSNDSIRGKDSNEDEVIAGYALIPDTGWTLVVEESWDELTQANRQYLYTLVGLLILGLVIPTAFVHISSRQIVQPLNELRKAASEVAHGNFDRSINPQTNDEVEDLAVEFNHMAAELHQMYTTLEEKVTQRTTELSVANQELQTLGEELQKSKERADAANQSKSIFLANMSHELRTPLNAILGFAQLMSRDPELPQRQRENLETIGRSGEHLLTLINDVLEMSKIEAGRASLRLAGLDLYRMIAILESMFELRALDKKLQINFEIDPVTPELIVADEGKLRQVLINLLNNAIKFTTQGGVTLRLRHRVDTTSEPPILLDFEVEDTGPGISPEEVSRLFSRFDQTSSGHKLMEGTGLGLAISYQFVKLMGGTLRVNSKLGEGSIFAFSIPVSLANPDDVEQNIETQPRHRVVGLVPGQPEFRILVVEDKEPNRRLMDNLLRTVGFQVRDAVNGQEAITIWKEWQPHLIWMDMRMPVMDGHEATRRIKSTDQGKHTVVIALSASAFEEERSLVLSEGCDDFVRKPFRESDIFERMERFLGVKYIYVEEERTGISHEKQRESDTREVRRTLKTLDASLLRQMNAAASQADQETLLQIIPQLCGSNHKLAELLENYANNYHFDILMTLTSQDDEGES